MNRIGLFAVLVILAAWHVPTIAQVPGPAGRVFARQELLRALSDALVVDQALRDPRTDWSRVRQLRPSSEILLSVRGAGAKRCRFVSADDATVTVVDLDSTSRPTLRVAREDVNQISEWTGRGGSRLGAVIGAGTGFFVGYLSAINLALKQCGGSCSERILIGASLVGMPIAGGWLGYRLPGGNRVHTTVYLRP